MVAVETPKEDDPALSAALDAMFEGVQIVGFDSRYLYLNDTAARHGRRPKADLVGRRMSDVYPGIEQTEMFGLVRRCLEERAPSQMLNLFTFPEGDCAWFELRIEPVPSGALILSIDVSVQKVAQDELRASQVDLATTLECLGEAVLSVDPRGRLLRMNSVATRLTGWTLEEARGRPLGELVRFLDRDRSQAARSPVERLLQEGGRRVADELLLVTRDGAEVPVVCSAASIHDDAGELNGVVVAFRDVGEQLAMASQLEQARKMETIGRLAGGVAHDFNNLLSVISGYSEMLLETLPRAGREWKKVEQIRAAGAQAASLTRQLLAFSRKQVLQPVAFDPTAVVERLEPMLRRLIRENVDLAVRARPDVHPVVVDPGQFEQIVLNLALNARDAMPEGGQLTIETANVELGEEYARDHADASPGPHVMLAVTDTGVGMDSATRDRIFDPFFTTKGLGRGTGLGLATVYGIVKQSGGNIWVYSEPGRGTTFKVYLPSARDAAPAATRASSPPSNPPRGTETILVVEDDAAVRELVSEVLQSAGYHVLDGGDGSGASDIVARYPAEIHLLLTDVILPGRSGRDLSEQLRRARPSMRVVFMSGYTDDAIVHHGVLDPGTPFIEKPVTPQKLLEQLRRFLA